MPAGRCAALRDDMVLLMEELRSAIPAVFESDEYRSRAGQIEAEFSERHERAFEELGAEAAKHQVGLLRTPAGFSFAPLKEGEVISAEDFAKLPDREKSRIERVIGELQEKLEGIIRNMVRWRKEQRAKLKQLNREMSLFAVGHHVDELKQRYAGFDKVLQYLDAVQQDVSTISLQPEPIPLAREKQLAPFDRHAVARVIEHSARLAGDARKLSANVRAVSDLLCEADYRSRQAGRDRATAADVEAAIEAARKRADRLRERVNEEILRGTVLIDTSGARAGQINGLSVFQLGDHAFAEPTRITATTRLGDGRVIDVQREVELGGAIHSKGVMILSAFLAARYSTNRPHSLSASLVFEQTYGLVEGDSASLAELCALLSSLADIPIRQSLAVTGSVNQLGEVQAIVREGMKYVMAGMSPMGLKRGIEKGVAAVVEELKRLSKPCTTSTEIEHVGSISANNDRGIGAIIAQAW